MTIKFNVPGSKRKELVKTIAAWLGEDVKYCGAPTFAYEIDYFTVDREGNLIFDDRADSEVIERLLEHLYDEGFESDISAVAEKLAAAPTIDSIEDIDSVTLSFPDTGFDEAAFERLKAICGAKASLITTAFDAISTEVNWNKEEHTIQFPWFKLDLSAKEDEKIACILFLNKLMEFAKTAKRVTAKEKDTDNEKYAFRCFLLRLGFIGDEFKGARKILLSRLSGSSAFKSGKAKEYRVELDGDNFRIFTAKDSTEADHIGMEIAEELGSEFCEVSEVTE